jgi:hypothetical protein
MKKNKPSNKIDKKDNIFNKDTFCLLFFIILIIIFFYDPLFTGKSYFVGDINALGYPMQNFKYDMGKACKLFLWNPYSYCGQPYTADIHTATFYPPYWMFFFVPTAIGIVLYTVIHFLMAGIFSYIFLRDMKMEPFASLAGCIAYAFSGFMIIRIMHINFVTDCALLPLSLYFINILYRKKTILISLLLGFSLASALLSGNYQTSIIIYMIVFMYFFGKLDMKNLKKDLSVIGLYIAGIVFSFMLMAVQLIPTFEYLNQTLRVTSGLPYDMATDGSLGLKELLMFIIPDYYGLPWQAPYYTFKPYYWEACFYIGIFPLLLMLTTIFLTKNKKILMIFTSISLLGFLLALGKYTPVYSLFYSYFPLFKSYRCPMRWLIFVMPGILYTTGLAVNQLLNIEKPLSYKENRNTIVGMVLPGIIMLSLLLLLLLIPPVSINGTLFFILTGFGGLTLIFLRLYGIIGKNLFAIFTTGILTISAFSFGFNINPTVDSSYFEQRAGQIFDILQNKIPPERIYYFPPGELHGTRNMTASRKISTLIGYNPLILKRYGEYIYYSEYKRPMTPEVQLEFIKQSNMIPLRNITSKMILLLNLTSVYSFSNYKVDVIPVENPYKRAFTVNNYKVITDDYKTLEYLDSKEFDPLSTVVFNEDPGIKNSENLKNVNFPVEFLTFEPDYIKIKVCPDNPCWLFLSEIYYPGWKAFVNGQETKVFRANYMFRAIQLQPGDSSVEFYFSPSSFRTGATISIIALLILAVVTFMTILPEIRKKVT